MRHVFVCTTEYSDHWARTIAKKKAQADAMSEEDAHAIRMAPVSKRPDGQIAVRAMPPRQHRSFQ
jgi:hypothetical protein